MKKWRSVSSESPHEGQQGLVISEIIYMNSWDFREWDYVDSDQIEDIMRKKSLEYQGGSTFGFRD